MWIRTSFAIACAMAFTIAHGTQHRDAATEVLEQCGEFSQAALRECLQGKVRESMKALSQAEARAGTSIDQWDEDERFVASSRDWLRTSTSVFLKYRDAQCAFAASLGGGAIGAALELRRLACVYALNTERTLALTRLAAGIPRK